MNVNNKCWPWWSIWDATRYCSKCWPPHVTLVNTPHKLHKVDSLVPCSWWGNWVRVIKLLVQSTSHSKEQGCESVMSGFRSPHLGHFMPRIFYKIKEPIEGWAFLHKIHLKAEGGLDKWEPIWYIFIFSSHLIIVSWSQTHISIIILNIVIWLSHRHIKQNPCLSPKKLVIPQSLTLCSKMANLLFESGQNLEVTLDSSLSFS